MQDQFKGNTYYLIRHGEAENNVRRILSSVASRDSYALTEAGRRAIGKTAHYLQIEKPDFIVASPIRRTQESATILSEALGIPLTIDERLCEARFGRFDETDCQSFLDFMKEHGGRTAGDPEMGIEGYMDIRIRVRTFLEDTQKAFQEKKIVIVSHADTLQELYAELLGEPVGAEQGAGKWFPVTASCTVMRTDGTIQSFVPGD